MAKEGALLDCLAASYRLDLDGGAYVQQLVDLVAPLLDHGLGVMGYTYDSRKPGPPVIDHYSVSKRFDPSWLPTFYAAVDASGIEKGSPEHPTGFQTWSHLTCGQASLVPGMEPILPFFEHIGGSKDAFAVNALDASGRGLWLGAPLKTTRKVADEQVTLFTRFAAHLASGFRLRRKAKKPRASAVLATNGKLLHGETANVVEARDDLRAATLAFDRARTKKMRSDVDLATKRWRPLVVAQWSLLDEFDTDGKRFVVAVENGPPTRTPRRELSEREHQVMTQAHLGHSDKVIAYELGLAVSTVRVLLHRAVQKLGAATRKEALTRFAATTKSPK